MERLTKYSDFAKCYLPFSLTDWDFDDGRIMNGKVINRLGKLEDVLEKYGVENANELDALLDHDLKQMLKKNIDLETLVEKYKAQNKKYFAEKIKAKQELAELKQKAIVPKFKVGQEIYYIYGNEIRSMFVSSIEITKTLIGYHSLRDFAQLENNCFATKEEAEQKLTEIKGEKDE